MLYCLQQVMPKNHEKKNLVMKFATFKGKGKFCMNEQDMK